MSPLERRHFLAVFLLGSGGLLLLLALIPTGSHPNLLGQPGRDVEYGLYQVFGIWAWVFPVVFFYFAVSRYQDKPLSRMRPKFLGLALGLIALCISTHALLPSPSPFFASQMLEGVEWGGKFGALVGDRMESVFTRFGTLVLCLLVLVFSAWLLEKEAHLLRVARSGLEGFGRGFQWFKSHGFEAFAVLSEKGSKTLHDWKTRKEEGRIAEDARRKWRGENGSSPATSSDPPEKKERISPARTAAIQNEPFLPPIRLKKEKNAAVLERAQDPPGGAMSIPWVRSAPPQR